MPEVENEQGQLKNILNRAIKKIRAPKKMKPSDWCEVNLTFSNGPKCEQRLKVFEFQKLSLDIMTNQKK
ncbi:hypothetical protein [Pantoea vagans]|uniref:hypothetical protein n=1 Tax=Pantoea vagans TaxID=470934 RepID=UPI00366C714E|nr:hypothetical protein [Pantoea vagans]